MTNPNLVLLVAIAQAMGPLCDQVVFVGGCATGLLLDDAGLMDVRPTEDVDAIVEVASLAGYHRLAVQLMQRGFKQTMADNTPPFRWYWNRMQLDLVPLDEKVLGFANPWYRVGYDHADLMARDKASLDIFWLKDDSLADSDNLPPPGVIAQEIVDDLEAALEQFRLIASDLQAEDTLT